MARKKVILPTTPETTSRETTPDIKIDDSSSSAAPARSPPTPKSAPRKRKMRRASTTKSAPDTAASDTVINVFSSVFRFIGEILYNAICITKKPLTILFSLYLIAVIVAWAYQYAQTSVFMVLSPICQLPGISLLDIPFCGYTPDPSKTQNGRKRGEKSNFPELINLQSNFEGILENSVGGSHMAMDLKKSEVAVRDLSILVRVSDLLCRQELSNRLDDFVQTAKSTSRGLSRFGSRVNGVVDSLLAMDEYALRALERARVSHIEASTGNVITSWALAPFKPWGGMAEAERDILATFVQTSNVMDNSIQRLILEAEIVLNDLDGLENQLNSIQEMVSLEDNNIKEKYNEVLVDLWTILGGNRKQLSNFASHRSLLANISVYRQKALAHVSASLIQLQQMQSDLEDLRDRVAAPAVMAGAGTEMQDIPLEVHINSIRKGVERLNLGRDKAKMSEHNYMKRMVSMHDEAIKALDMGLGPGQGV